MWSQCHSSDLRRASTECRARRGGVTRSRRATRLRALIPVLVAAGFFASTGRPRGQQQGQTPPGENEGFRFRSGVELINVTATVTDSSGRFVPNLRQQDFTVDEDGVPQQITHFSNDRVPVSLGIALDTSGSMAGERIRAAKEALDRFLYDLLDDDDEIFLYRFSDQPELVESWTTNRDRLRRALGGVMPRGGTALYDTVADAVPLAQTGSRRKKALLVISDGNDTSSSTQASELKPLVRESEVLVYAIGIDAPSETWSGRSRQPRMPVPIPFPIPGRRPPPTWPGYPPPGYPGGSGTGGSGGRGRIQIGGERANISALRELTDDSGGRTEVIRTASDLDPATASIADELSKQYYLAYPSPQLKDGRWHSIEVRAGNPSYRVRARRGYIATK
jgi:Ca-activated chloride channel homolog